MRLKIFVPIIVFCFVIACGNKTDKPNPRKKQAGPITQSRMSDKSVGQALFRKNCTLCHGRNGKRGINGAKDLTKSTMTLDEKIAIIRDGKGLMTGFKFLGEEKIKQLAEYVESIE